MLVADVGGDVVARRHVPAVLGTELVVGTARRGDAHPGSSSLARADATRAGGTFTPMSLPPGPRGPAAVQSLRLLLQPIDFLERCLRRYGDVFTLRFIGMGDLVYVADTETVKDIFTGDPSVFHAGEANEIMEPVLGSRSVLLLDEDEHLRERRLLLPPFHGERVRRYRRARRRDRRRRDRAVAARTTLRAAAPDAGDHARGDPARGVRDPRGASGSTGCATLLPKMLDHGDRRRVDAVPAARPRAGQPVAAVRAGARRGRRAAARRDPRGAAKQRTSRSATTCSRCCSRRATRTGSR